MINYYETGTSCTHADYQRVTQIFLHPNLHLLLS